MPSGRRLAPLKYLSGLPPLRRATKRKALGYMEYGTPKIFLNDAAPLPFATQGGGRKIFVPNSPTYPLQTGEPARHVTSSTVRIGDESETSRREMRRELVASFARMAFLPLP